MSNQLYKKGDRIVIRSWADMEGEYGLRNGDIPLPLTFAKGMRDLCGNSYTIDEVRRDYSPHYKLKAKSKEYRNQVPFNISPEMIKGLAGVYEEIKKFFVSDKKFNIDLI